MTETDWDRKKFAEYSRRMAKLVNFINFKKLSFEQKQELREHIINYRDFNDMPEKLRLIIIELEK